MSDTPWIRYRFHSSDEDYRPVLFPPPGPYWCTGWGDDYSIVVAYLPQGESLTTYWPDASCVDEEEVSEIVFNDRFVCPDWYVPVPPEKAIW